MSYIYNITNVINNKFYIGSSVNYIRRWEQHRYELNRDKHINKHLQRAWNKYKEENFEFDILEECDINKQYEREQYYLDTLQPFGNIGYNMSRIANGSNGDNADYEVITKIKELMKQCYSNNEISLITKKTETMIDCVRSLRSWEYVSPKLNIFLNNRSKLKTINNNCIIKFGIPIEELKNKKSKTNEQEEFLTDMNNCLNDYDFRLNRIKEDEEEYFYYVLKGVLKYEE